MKLHMTIKCHDDKDPYHSIYPLMSSGMCWVACCVKALGWCGHIGGWRLVPLLTHVTTAAAAGAETAQLYTAINQ